MGNGHGGRRTGSGRKRGYANEKTRKIADGAAAAGLTPLEYALEVMRDPAQPLARRDAMAAMAMPYMHARLANIVVDREPDAPQVTTINVISVPPGVHYTPEQCAQLRLGHALPDDLPEWSTTIDVDKETPQ